MLKLDHVTIGRNNKDIIENLEFEFKSGAVCALAAPNGYGKSTLLSVLAGNSDCLVKGMVYANGVPMYQQADYCGQVFYAAGGLNDLYQNESGRFHLEAVSSLWGSSLPISYIVDSLSLAEFIDCKIKQMSSGMQQLIRIASALVSRTSILLFDEPMNWLDPMRRALVKKQIKEQARNGRTIVIASHILEDFAALADEVLLIDKNDKTIVKKRNITIEQYQSYYE